MYFHISELAMLADETYKCWCGGSSLNDFLAELLKPLYLTAVGLDLILHLLMALEEALSETKG